MDNMKFASKIDLSGKSILITGGTGSFGKALIRHLLDKYSPRRIIIFARGEYNHFELQNSLTDDEKLKVRFFIGDVRDLDRLIMAFRGVDIVIHAAAQKQVPLAEYNPFECIRTNVMGAENIVQAALRTEVKNVVALSTDKAVNPINLYGASKLASDKIFVAANNLSSQSGSKFSVVRYGNVLGSRGSVIPFFKKLLSEGATELPITDTQMTRFWITLEQAVNFTLSCLDLMRGGEVFVPKIPSMKIMDLVEAIAPGIPTKHVGIRPGEKLHEIMITDYNARHTVDLGDRFAIEPELSFTSRKSYRNDGFGNVPEGFEYTSNSNSDWLTIEDLVKILPEVCA